MAEEILPELLNIYREREDSPSIQVFDSLEFYEYTGQLLMENLKAGEEALIYAHVNFFATQTEKTAETWFKIMRNKKYKTKILIYGDGEKEREHIRKCKATKNPNLQVRMIKNMEFPVKTEQAIFGNNIAMFTGGNKYSTILIDSENMANTFKQVFYQIWKDGEEV